MDILNYNSLHWFGHLVEEHFHIPAIYLRSLQYKVGQYGFILSSYPEITMNQS